VAFLPKLAHTWHSIASLDPLFRARMVSVEALRMSPRSAP
jgi:hypothetical protein